MTEEWRPVHGYEGYEASSHGRVRSWKRKNLRILKPEFDRQGYARAGLYQDRKLHRIKVSVLVCSAWHGPRPEGQVCRHLDGSKDNDAPENLCWGSYSQNNGHDRILHGTMPFGEKNGNSSLTEKMVQEIRASTDSQNNIAKKLGVSKSAVKHVQRGRVWKHI